DREPPEVDAPVPFGETCWMNGSLLANRLNEVSWSIDAVEDPVDEARSAEDGVVDVEEPPRVGGARDAVGVVVELCAARSGSTPGPVSCLSIFGPSNPSTASRSTPSTPARI